MNFQPLSGMDAGFLYMETPTLHMHTLKVALLRPSERAGGILLSNFERTMERNLEKLPSFKQKIMPIPFGLGHPVWVWDENFDLSRHLAHQPAPAPGTVRELNAIVSEIASKPLHRDRPLWEITMVDGLEQGQVAFVCKLHHSMADGAAALAMLVEVLARPGSGAEPRDHTSTSAPTTEASRRVMRAPTNWEITRWAVGQRLRRAASLPQLAWRTIRGLFALARRSRQGPHPHLPRPFSGPDTGWTGALSARRSFATTTLPLNEMMQIKRSLGVTLNDVVLGVCGGALRAHLEEVEGAVPEKSVIASVPINTHPEMVERTRGNHVGHLTASLCTDISDPIQRIRAIHEIMDESKQRQMAIGVDLLERWVEHTPPKPYAAVMRFWSRRHIADHVPSPVDLVISNVRGPSEPLLIGDTKLEAIYSVGPILEGAGLNLTGWSYGDKVYFVGLACPDQISDIQRLTDRLPKAFAEIVRACEPFLVEPIATASRLPADEFTHKPVLDEKPANATDFSKDTQQSRTPDVEHA
jgi:diacylglycerol O-acyltransferase